MNELTAARILVVDDRPDVRLSLLYMLQASGFLVAEAGNGMQALAEISKGRVDVVLTDLYMPEMDGLGLVKAIVSQGPRHPKIVVMTGSEHLGHAAALDAASILGADAVLSKPFSRNQLLEKIRTQTPRSPRGAGRGAEA